MEGGDIVTQDILKSLAIEILKAKCNLSNSSEKDILNNYFNILSELEKAYKETAKYKNSISILKE